MSDPKVFGIIDKHRAEGIMLITHGHDSLKDGDKLIRLTDHEAALNAMREDRDSHQRLCIDQMLINDELLGLLREVSVRATLTGWEPGLTGDINATLAKLGKVGGE